jgi:glycosyltransferase involved in cell wall biosynthesis
MPSDLTVSVIVPAYNQAGFLPEAVASIWEQTQPPMEVIVVDDGSTDATPEVAATLDGIQYVRQDHRGPAAARNRGIECSTGSCLAFLDADDCWLPDKLERQIAVMQARPGVDIVLGYTQFVHTTAARDATGAPTPIPSFGSALIRRMVFDRIGAIDETLHYSEDVDWFMRALEQGCHMQVIQEVAQRCRRHSSNMTEGKSATGLNLFHVLKRSLDRRRGRHEKAPSMVASVFSRLERSSENPPS